MPAFSGQATGGDSKTVPYLRARPILAGDREEFDVPADATTPYVAIEVTRKDRRRAAEITFARQTATDPTLQSQARDVA
jgi:hypothetical protein